MVDEDGIIKTIIGISKGQRSWKPISCHGTSRLEDVSLRWPSDLAINPLDNSLQKPEGALDHSSPSPQGVPSFPLWRPSFPLWRPLKGPY